MKTSKTSLLTLIVLIVSCWTFANWQFFSASADAKGDAEPIAQGGAMPGAPAYANATLIADTSAIKPGTPFKLGVQLDMLPGWHTYYKESGDAGMPTRIQWHLPAGFTASDLLWEKPFKFNEEGIVTYGYKDKTLIAALITPPADLKPGQHLNFSADVKWLTCKEACVPGKGTVSIDLDSVDSGAHVEAKNSEAFAAVGFNGNVKDLKEENEPKIKKSILDDDIHLALSTDQSNLPLYLLMAFVGGFILNFMPCVLPVISIKILNFMQQAGTDPKQVFKLGLVFVSGIISSFMFLAATVIGIQQAGQQIGWGFQFQYPVFLVFLCAVVLLFALSLFGVFFVQISPGTALDKLSGKEGMVGNFFKGVLATVLSTPCTAPFLGPAIGFAFTEPWWVIALFFFVVAVGMSFPYVLLTARPQWMRYLPKPGDWMEKFKESMGFLLLATVVWLLWVLGQQVGNDAVFAAIAFLTALAFAAWLVGRFLDLTSSPRKQAMMYLIAAGIVGVAFYACLMRYPQLLSTSPSLGDPVNLDSSNEHHSRNALAWMPFSITSLDNQIGEGKTIFLDFTADWCLTCKVNENTILDTPAVVEKMKALNVVAMKGDWTRQDPQISRILKKFGRSGVPLYVVLPAGHPEEPIILPEVITQDMVLKALDDAGPSK